MAVTEAVCSTHSLRVTRLNLAETTDDTKHYARVTYIRACSRLVNFKLDPIVMIHIGMKYEFLRAQHDILWCENEFLCMYHVICLGVKMNVCMYLHDMLWCAKCMFTYAIQYDLV